jgi:hypothetical protein
MVQDGWFGPPGHPSCGKQDGRREVTLKEGCAISYH